MGSIPEEQHSPVVLRASRFASNFNETDYMNAFTGDKPTESALQDYAEVALPVSRAFNLGVSFSKKKEAIDKHHKNRQKM